MRAIPAENAAPAETAVAVAQPELADRVSDAVLAVEGVEDLHSGTFGEVATYLPGRRVTGIRIRPEATEVHVVLRWGAPVRATADAVRAVAGPLVGTPVHVFVQDVVDPVADRTA